MSFFSLKKPDGAALQRFTEAQRAQRPSYPYPHMTRQSAPPSGFTAKRTRAALGKGEVFRQAVAGLKTWAVYPPWMTLYPQHPPVQVGACVTILTGFAGVWTMSAVRVIAIQETSRRFSFTLGTLPQHAVSGEERFSVTWDKKGRVWFEIKAFSKPQHPLVKLGSPVLSFVQRRFARESVRSLRAFIG